MQGLSKCGTSFEGEGEDNEEKKIKYGLFLPKVEMLKKILRMLCSRKEMWGRLRMQRLQELIYYFIMLCCGI